MESSEGGPTKESRLVLGGDGFLLAAALDMVIISVFAALMSAALPGDAPLWLQGGSGIMTIVLALAGPVLVWWLHGRRFDIVAVIGMIVGAGVGGAIAAAIFIGFGMLPRLFGVSSDQPPWGGIAALAVVALALAVVSLVEAIRDLGRTPPRRRGLDWLRIAAFVALAGTVGVFTYLGVVQHSEAAEAGIFATLFGLASAFAVMGADLLAKPTADAPAQHPTASA